MENLYQLPGSTTQRHLSLESGVLLSLRLFVGNGTAGHGTFLYIHFPRKECSLNFDIFTFMCAPVWKFSICFGYFWGGAFASGGRSTESLNGACKPKRLDLSSKMEGRQGATRRHGKTAQMDELHHLRLQDVLPGYGQLAFFKPVSPDCVVKRQ